MRSGPGSFAARPFGERLEQVVTRPPAPLMSASWTLGGFVGRNDGPSSVTDVLYFRLHSPAQPDVRGFACGSGFDDPSRVEAPTPQEIEAALGDYATLVPR